MKFATAATATFLACTLFTPVPSAAELTITVTEIEQAEGHLMIALFDSETSYDEGSDAAKGLRVPVDGMEVSVTVEDLPAGQYAIKMYHDANDNGSMDQNAVGIPTERYGFSSNKGRFGPPPFDVAAVKVSDDQENATTIKLR